MLLQVDLTWLVMVSSTLDSSGVLAQASLGHQLLEILELSLHLSQLLPQHAVPLLQRLHIVLNVVHGGLLLLAVPKGRGPVLGLLAFLLVQGIGAGGSLGRLGAGVLLPWLVLGGRAPQGRVGVGVGAPLRVRLSLGGERGNAMVLGGGAGGDDDDDVLAVLSDHFGGHSALKLLETQTGDAGLRLLLLYHSGFTLGLH